MVPKKLDLTKVRAREAASKLRRAKQEKLDEQKRILDRKLQARYSYLNRNNIHF